MPMTINDLNLILKIKYILFLFLPILLLNSCGYFSDDEKEMQVKRALEWKREREDKENKNFQYIKQLVSYKSNISKDTVAIVLKEYYLAHEGFSFNNNTGKLDEIEDYPYNEIDKLDFINSIIQKHNLNEKTAFLLFYEIDFILKMQSMEDEISNISYTVQ